MRVCFVSFLVLSSFACGSSPPTKPVEVEPPKPQLGAEEQALADRGNTDAGVIGIARECDGGRLAACTDLGQRYRGGDGVPRDPERGVALYEKACGGDELRACALLGGALTPTDPTRARTLTTRACDGGNVIGCFNLGYLHAHGLGGSQSFDEAARLYERACEGRVPQGCTNLAEMWELGEGRKVDLARAAELHGKACALEPVDHYGCAGLSVYLASGKGGVKKDAARALALAQAACDASEPYGCRQLGLFQRDGVGMKKDPAASVQSLQKACDAEDGPACNALGNAYRKGQGTTKDVDRAKAAFDVACNKGKVEDACKALKTLK